MSDTKGLKDLLLKFGIVPNDVGLYIISLTHRSFGRSNNERLEFLGDSVIELVISHQLFVDFPDKGEGELTSLRAALVRADSLSEEAKRIKLNEFLTLSRSEEKSGGREKPVILAGLFEAFTGAIYLDQNFEVSRRFIIENVYYKVSTIIKKRLNIDPKTELQEIVQDRYKLTPVYRLISAEGPDHDKIFTVQVVIGEINYAIGRGRSKQSAEQEAARLTLEQLRTNNFKL